MTDEGYLQNKIRELKEQVEEIEKKVESVINHLEASKRGLAKSFDEQVTRLKPFLDSEAAISKWQDYNKEMISNLVGASLLEAYDLNFKTFDKEIKVNKENFRLELSVISNFYDEQGKALTAELDARLKNINEKFNEALKEIESGKRIQIRRK